MAGDYKVLDLNSSQNRSARSSSNNTQSSSVFSTKITVGKLGVTIGNVLDDSGQPIAYTVYIPGQNNPVMFNATETAVAIVFMHPLLNDYDVQTANTIVNKIKQSPNFIALVGEVAERMQNGHLNISGQNFDPTSFDNYLPIVTYLLNDTYDNSSVNEDGIKIVDVNQDNEFVTFKVENYRKRWLKITPSVFTNGNTSNSSFYSETANIYFPHGYVGSININLLKQVFSNPDLTDLHNTSIQFKVKKENAQQLYLNLYGNGLDEFANIPEQLLDNHLDVVIISTFQDFVLPIYQMITGISDLKETLGKQEKILVGRPHDDPYNKFLERLIAYVGTNAFKLEYKNLVDDEKPFLAIKLTISKIFKFILNDVGNHPQDFYKILKDQFGEQVIKQNKEVFKKALNGYNTLNSSLSFLSSGANALAFANTVLYSDWHNQKRIDLTYDNSPIVQTDPVISNLTGTSASISGNIVDDNGSGVIASGICWNTNVLFPPNLSDDFTIDGQPSGIFTSNLTGLVNETTYYARAYATNPNGTSYGEVVSFTTNPPIEVTAISPLTATLGTETTFTITGTNLPEGMGFWIDNLENPTEVTGGNNTTRYFKGTPSGVAGSKEGVIKDAPNGTTLFNFNVEFTQAQTTPTVTTTAITNSTQTTATSGGNITDDGGSTVTAKGVCWSTSQNPTLSNASYTTDGTGTAFYTSSLTGLTAATTYYVRAYATNSIDTAYGNEQSFTTQNTSSSGNVTDIDGNTYPTVIIGTQEWMAEDLRVTHYPNGDDIPHITDNATWGNLANNNTSDAYSFYNNDNTTVYGALYTYAAAIADNWTRDNNANQGVCPNGWHLPTDTEWTTLTDYLGGTSVAGGKMKETGTTHWNSPNTGATNSSGFAALPGGARLSSGGAFGNVGFNGNWWSGTEYGSSYAYNRNLRYSYANAYRNYYDKSYGFCVRCIRD